MEHPDVTQSEGEFKDMAYERHKGTFHLTEELINDLEDAWLQLRKKAKPGKKKQVSKSGIVRAALEMALEDLKAEGTKSRLTKKLLS